MGCRALALPSARGRIAVTIVLVAVAGQRGKVTAKAAATTSQSWTASKGVVLSYDQAVKFFRDINRAEYVGPAFERAEGTQAAYSLSPRDNGNGRHHVNTDRDDDSDDDD